MRNPKNKGSEFERQISKILSLWLTNRDDSFWRTHNSGGRFTCRLKVGKDTLKQEGDITSVSSEGEIFTDLFYIECKHYKNVNLWSLITGTGLLYDWCLTYLHKSRELSKKLFLVVRENYKPILVITNSDIFLTKYCKYKLSFFLEEENFYVFLLDDVLKMNFGQSLKNGKG